MLADIYLLLIPLWILLGLLFLLGIVALLGRIKGGKYLRPVIGLISKVPLFRRGLQKASNAALERSNPELASAMKKMRQRSGALRDPNRAQAAMSQLTPQERRALLAGAGGAGRARARDDEPPDAPPDGKGQARRPAPPLARARQSS